MTVSSSNKSLRSNAGFQLLEELKCYRDICVHEGWGSGSDMVLQTQFPDSEGLLDTAYYSLKRLNIKNLKVITEQIITDNFEEYTVKTEPGVCRISANDTEGIRRGIYFLVDLLRMMSPTEFANREWRRTPWLKRRISRCFFGPIKRPPMNRDELTDDVDYYPEAYLERLASEAVNALWISISMDDLCVTKFTLGAAPDKEKRFAKLQRTVDKCRRYGIKIYLFCNEPAARKCDDETVKKHTGMFGPEQSGVKGYCPVSAECREYLYEVMHGIFSSVRNLGGMIDIVYGEGHTGCLSFAEHDGTVHCDKKCSDCNPPEIMSSMLKSMYSGMRDAAPESEFIAWFYIPSAGNIPEWIFDVIGNVPEGVIPQLNFESGVEREQLGKKRIGGDYWQCVPEPSGNFARFAEINGSRQFDFSAKIQVGSSHEVATVPFVPVPLLLYRKFKHMHDLGVTHSMFCWYFGNYPGIMNDAAGELSFTDFSKTGEHDFLNSLAAKNWGKEHAADVEKIWRIFSNAYENYPLSNMFQYFGPVADGVRWPLYLFPAEKMLKPTWLLDEAPSGDNLCECLHDHTLDEAVELLEKLSAEWSDGSRMFSALRRCYTDSEEHLKDIDLAEALGIQFSSAYNILRFYQLRNELYRTNDASVLESMKHLAEKEAKSRERLITLAESDPRLGFHPEAEGYKYSPEMIRNSIDSIYAMLCRDFPKAKTMHETGNMPQVSGKDTYTVGKDSVVSTEKFEWAAEKKNQRLIIRIKCFGRYGVFDEIAVAFDNKGKDFPLLFHAASSGRIYLKVPQSECEIIQHCDSWDFSLTLTEEFIPWKSFKDIRINIIRFIGDYTNRYSWPFKNEPTQARLGLVLYNPANMGELKFTQDEN